MHTFFASLLSAPASSLGAAADSSGEGLFAFMIIFLLVILALCVLTVVSMWKIFKKAGRPGWASIIPFYNYAVALEIVRKPLWWIVLLFFAPVVNLVLVVIVARRFAAVFGKGAWFTVGMILLPFIFLPILAFGPAVYENRYEAARPMSEATKWALIAAFAFMVLEGLWVIGGLAAGSMSERDHMYGSDASSAYGDTVSCADTSESGNALGMSGVYDGPTSEMANLAPTTDRDGTTVWDLSSPAVSDSGYVLSCQYGKDETPVEYPLPTGTVCTGMNNTNIECLLAA